VIPINPNDPPVLVVDCVTLLDIICAFENAGILGTFCTALLITGLAPGLELGCAGGNRRRYQDNPGNMNNIPLEAQRIIDQYNQNYPGNNYIPPDAQLIIDQYYRPANIGNRLLQYPGNNNYIPAQTQAILDQYTPGNNNNYVGNEYNNGNNYNYNGINAPLQHTVFGPTNDAFIKLGDTTLRRLFNTDQGREDLTEILFYHIIQGSRLDFHQLNCGQSYTMLNEQPTTSRCRARAGDNINGIWTNFQVGTGNGNNVDNWPELIDWNKMAVNGVLHVVDEVILQNNMTPSPSCPCASQCLRSVTFTYNGFECNPASSQSTDYSASNFCEDDDDEGLPNGIRYELFDCTRNAAGVNPIGGRSGRVYLNQSVRLNGPGEVLFGQCLPQCVQVRLFDTNEDSRERVQSFNIDTRCSENSLVEGRNYGAFQYVGYQCPGDAVESVQTGRAGTRPSEICFAEEEACIVDNDECCSGECVASRCAGGFLHRAVEKIQRKRDDN